jgi:hypothetical protein
MIVVFSRAQDSDENGHHAVVFPVLLGHELLTMNRQYEHSAVGNYP